MRLGVEEALEREEKTGGGETGAFFPRRQGRPAGEAVPEIVKAVREREEKSRASNCNGEGAAKHWRRRMSPRRTRSPDIAQAMMPQKSPSRRLQQAVATFQRHDFALSKMLCLFLRRPQ